LPRRPPRHRKARRRLEARPLAHAQAACLLPVGAHLAAGELAAQLSIAPATLSFHLKELLNAGLVGARPVGRFVFYTANYRAMNDLLAYLTENCCAADCDDNECAPGVRHKPGARRNAKITRASGRKPVRSKA